MVPSCPKWLTIILCGQPRLFHCSNATGDSPGAPQPAAPGAHQPAARPVLLASLSLARERPLSLSLSLSLVRACAIPQLESLGEIVRQMFYSCLREEGE